MREVATLRKLADGAERDAGALAAARGAVAAAHEEREHLLGQVDVASAQGEIIESMTMEHQQLQDSVEELTAQLETVQEEAEVSAEMEVLLREEVQEHEAMCAALQGELDDTLAHAASRERTVAQFRELTATLRAEKEALESTGSQAGASSSDASQQIAASRREALALRAQLRKQQRFGVETTLASLGRAHRSLRVRWLRSALPPTVLRTGEFFVCFLFPPILFRFQFRSRSCEPSS